METTEQKHLKLISLEYKEQNRLLHESGEKFGHRGSRHIPKLVELIERYGCKDVCDYGCGKADLSKYAEFPVTNYDPAVPEFDKDPKPCDLLVSTDVLEHIEIDLLENVLSHMQSKMKKAGYFVINTREDRSKTLPDGSNPHKIQEGLTWWEKRLSKYFHIEQIYQIKHIVFCIVKPL